MVSFGRFILGTDLGLSADGDIPSDVFIGRCVVVALEGKGVDLCGNVSFVICLGTVFLECEPCLDSGKVSCLEPKTGPGVEATSADLGPGPEGLEGDNGGPFVDPGVVF